MSCKDNRCKYNHDGIGAALEKIAIVEGGGLLEAAGLLNFSRLRLGRIRRGGGGLLEAGGLLQEIRYINLLIFPPFIVPKQAEEI